MLHWFLILSGEIICVHPPGTIGLYLCTYPNKLHSRVMEVGKCGIPKTFLCHNSNLGVTQLSYVNMTISHAVHKMLSVDLLAIHNNVARNLSCEKYLQPAIVNLPMKMLATWLSCWSSDFPILYLKVNSDQIYKSTVFYFADCTLVLEYIGSHVDRGAAGKPGN